MAKNIFNTFSNCLKQYKYNPEDEFNSFMFCRYLSNSPKTIKAAQVINIYYNQMDNQTQYEFVKGLNPPRFIKWISIPKEPDLTNLVEKYNISKEKARDYNSILNKIKGNENG